MDSSAAYEWVEQSQRQLNSYARRHDAGTIRPWRPDEKKLANERGRGDEYLDFRLTHHFVHGSTVALTQRYTKVGDDTIEVGGPAAHLAVWAEGAALFAASSLLHATQAASRIYDWSEPRELADLMHRTEELAEERRPAFAG
jgi:hypothetical protein